ncbi:interleukin-10 receptor subunit alpha [Misgurnus anguillicaudatus]|uniref:interleukin-10 receptor subunit alpha n=1 Tax=Misgurnus anguillicaudatus TaxID=75329 RepID=UPI003CCFAB67
MDWSLWMSALVLLIHTPLYVAGEGKKINMTFDIWEGNVTVLWSPPDGAPLNALYQVSQAIYGTHDWHVVPKCNMIKETTCNIGNIIDQDPIKVKVGLFQGNVSLAWSFVKRVHLSESKLLAPDFHLFSTPKTVKVKIFRKQFSKKLFPYGPLYTVTLRLKGDDQIISQNKDDDEDGEVEFGSLQLFQEYCINVTVEMKSDNSRNTSSQCCIYPSEDISMVIYMVTVGVVGPISVFMLAVCFFLKRPGKMPAVLKSAVNEWRPMNVGSVQVESVTDKGWLMISNKMSGKNKTLEYTEEDKDRRESTDSGVSVSEQHSDKVERTDAPGGNDDSGCGSLTGSEDGGRSLEELPCMDGGVTSSSCQSREDSGLGLGNRDVSDNLKGDDSGLLSEIVIVGDGYRSQSPSGDEHCEITVPCDVDSNTDGPSGGYRSGQVTCLCSDFETCMWCRTGKLLMTVCDSASHEQTTADEHDRPSYLQKSPAQDANVLGLGDLAFQSDEDCCESSTLLISCPLFLQEEHNLQCRLDTLPLTLGDVELSFT